MEDEIARFITGDAFFLMFAGTDTTAFSMMRALVLLHEHPQWFRKLQEEQDRLRQEYGDTINRKVTPASRPPRPVISLLDETRYIVIIHTYIVYPESGWSQHIVLQMQSLSPAGVLLKLE